MAQNASNTIHLPGMAAYAVPKRDWPPTKYLEYEATVATKGCGPARVWTDAGRAYLKPMAADVNPHSLAVELVCTRLADWMGLPVLETCILDLADSDTFPRPTRSSTGHADPDSSSIGTSKPGPAFCTRGVIATQWDGADQSISAIENTNDIAKLVVFDTWIRNEDRCPPVDSAGVLQSTWQENLGNVLLVRSPPKVRILRLVAMDFGHAIVKGRELPTQSFGVNADKDEWVYGLFRAFRRFVTPPLVDAAAAKLNTLGRDELEDLISEIPLAWDVSVAARTVLADHLYRRAAYLADTIKTRLAPLCYPQGTMLGW